MPFGDNTEWMLTARAEATAISVNKPAEAGKSHYITHISGSYDSNTGALLVLTYDTGGSNTELYALEIDLAEEVPFPHPLKIPKGVDVQLDMAAGGAGVEGAINLGGFTV